MIKRTCLALSIGLLAAAALWLLRESDDAAKPSGVAKEVQGTEVAEPAAGAMPETSALEEEIPESERHAAGEIERHRASRLQLVALEKAVMDQEDKLEERRRILAAIVRTKGIIYKGTDMKIEPPAKAPATHPDTAETPGESEYQAGMARKEAEERGRDAMAYVDAKRDFQTDEEQLKQMKLKLEEERARLKVGKNR